jgi:hypothetical protein
MVEKGHRECSDLLDGPSDSIDRHTLPCVLAPNCTAPHDIVIITYNTIMNRNKMTSCYVLPCVLSLYCRA